MKREHILDNERTYSQQTVAYVQNSKSWNINLIWYIIINHRLFTYFEWIGWWWQTISIFDSLSKSLIKHIKSFKSNFSIDPSPLSVVLCASNVHRGFRWLCLFSFKNNNKTYITLCLCNWILIAFNYHLMHVCNIMLIFKWIKAGCIHHKCNQSQRIHVETKAQFEIRRKNNVQLCWMPGI